MIISLEPGIGYKSSLYNWLFNAGCFLPSYNSNCVTVESLSNHRNKKFHFYFCDQLEAALKIKDVLICPPDLCYDFIQRFHIEKFNKPLPFEKVPPEDFLKVIMRHIDPENAMQFLRSVWNTNYDCDIIEVDNVVIRAERPQGQSVQKKIDNVINNALRLRNSRIASKYRLDEAEKAFKQAKSVFSDKELAELRDDDLELCLADDPQKVYDGIIDKCLKHRRTKNEPIIIKDEGNITHTSFAEQSDQGEDLPSGASDEDLKLDEARHNIAVHQSQIGKASSSNRKDDSVPKVVQMNKSKLTSKRFEEDDL